MKLAHLNVFTADEDRLSSTWQFPSPWTFSRSPSCPSLPFRGDSVPLNQTAEESWYPYSNLSGPCFWEDHFGRQSLGHPLDRKRVIKRQCKASWPRGRAAAAGASTIPDVHHHSGRRPWASGADAAERPRKPHSLRIARTSPSCFTSSRAGRWMVDG